MSWIRFLIISFFLSRLSSDSAFRIEERETGNKLNTVEFNGSVLAANGDKSLLTTTDYTDNCLETEK